MIRITSFHGFRQSIFLTFTRVLSFENEVVLEKLFSLLASAVFLLLSLVDYVYTSWRIIEDGMRSEMERGSILNMADHTVAWHTKGPSFDLSLYIAEMVVIPLLVFLFVFLIFSYFDWKMLSKASFLRIFPKFSQIVAFLVIFCVCLNLASPLTTSVLTLIQKSREIYIDQNDPGFQVVMHFSISVSVVFTRGNLTQEIQSESNIANKVLENKTISREVSWEAKKDIWAYHGYQET